MTEMLRYGVGATVLVKPLSQAARDAEEQPVCARVIDRWLNSVDGTPRYILSFDPDVMDVYVNGDGNGDGNIWSWGTVRVVYESDIVRQV